MRICHCGSFSLCAVAFSARGSALLAPWVTRRPCLLFVLFPPKKKIQSKHFTAQRVRVRCRAVPYRLRAVPCRAVPYRLRAARGRRGSPEGGGCPGPGGATVRSEFALMLQSQFKVSAIGLQQLCMPSVPGRVCARTLQAVQWAMKRAFGPCAFPTQLLWVLFWAPACMVQSTGCAELQAVPVGGRGHRAPFSELLLC